MNKTKLVKKLQQFSIDLEELADTPLSTLLRNHKKLVDNIDSLIVSIEDGEFDTETDTEIGL